MWISNSNSTTVSTLFTYGKNDEQMVLGTALNYDNSGVTEREAIFVRKGTRLYFDIVGSSSFIAFFYPLDEE